jgi:hypothetical protein
MVYKFLAFYPNGYYYNPNLTDPYCAIYNLAENQKVSILIKNCAPIIISLQEYIKYQSDYLTDSGFENIILHRHGKEIRDLFYLI